MTHSKRRYWVGMLAPLAMMNVAEVARAADGPEYTGKAELQAPVNYREWVFLSSGLGMVYGPLAAGADRGHPRFDNVFVNPSSYRKFLGTGHWPDKTIFVLEVRGSESHGSINNGGHFQSDVIGVEAEVKDSSAKEGEWTFYGFSTMSGEFNGPAKATPRTASCYSCHAKNAAVENTFVQFYPALYGVAERKGTLNPGFLKMPLTAGRLFELVREQGWEKGAAALDATAAHAPDAAVLEEHTLNMLGYELIQAKQPTRGVSLLEWAAARYPKSANLQGSLAKAYMAVGNKDSSRAAAEKTLVLLKADDSIPADDKARLAQSVTEHLKQLAK